MNISAKVTDERVLDVRFDEHSLIVDLMDGRTISAPLAWYPRLANASVEQRTHWEKCGVQYDFQDLIRRDGYGNVVYLMPTFADNFFASYLVSPFGKCQCRATDALGEMRRRLRHSLARRRRGLEY